MKVVFVQRDDAQLDQRSDQNPSPQVLAELARLLLV